MASDFSKLRWIFMIVIWIIAELVSIAAFGYAFYSFCTLLSGEWIGALVFAGFVSGLFLCYTIVSLYKLVRVPWRAGDYQSGASHEYQVRQMRPFHTILWCDEKSKALPHAFICISSSNIVSRRGESNVYNADSSSGFGFKGRKRWLAYVWAVSCEIFLAAVLFAPLFVMFWLGVEATLSFLSGLVCVPNTIGFLFFCNYMEKEQSPSNSHVFGPTWTIQEDHGSLHLRHLMVHDLL